MSRRSKVGRLESLRDGLLRDDFIDRWMRSCFEPYKFSYKEEERLKGAMLVGGHIRNKTIYYSCCGHGRCVVWI